MLSIAASESKQQQKASRSRNYRKDWQSKLLKKTQNRWQRKRARKEVWLQLKRSLPRISIKV